MRAAPIVTRAGENATSSRSRLHNSLESHSSFLQPGQHLPESKIFSP